MQKLIQYCLCLMLGYKYELTTFTGNRFGAGTDSNVFVILYGDNGNTGRKILEHNGANDFERGQ